jgi:tetratricopeptide (TPR) repeat protein
MELVKGTPITAFCDARQLTPQQRLELFIPVCQAIQHAHQKGVIHRDIKPANVLVALYDDKPVPKVIDFGVAKATGGTLTELTIDTGFGGVVGTPQYMSPEQATFNNLDIDTRSDVYSLGVLLYELLAGSPPFAREELRKAGVLEILRVVREEEPPRPSVKLSTAKARPSIAASRGTEPARLTGLLRSELDWIVMKALDKDRGRRYETANGFAADVRRYLNREPVVARPPSTTYKLRKAWQRNQLPFAAAAVVAASLLLGVAASTWQAVRANREATRADGEAALVSAALDELRATAPAFAEQARGLAAREQFDAAVEKLDYAAKLRPDEADYPLKKGDLLQCQLLLADAAASYRAALDRRPGDGRAQANLTLCEELLAEPRGPDGQLTREQLSKLLAAMERQQRPAAELMSVSRRLGVERSHALAYWADRLRGLPVAADRPLAQRLTVRADGALALDLGDTGVTDLAPLEGAPIADGHLGPARHEVDGTGPFQNRRGGPVAAAGNADPREVGHQEHAHLGPRTPSRGAVEVVRDDWVPRPGHRPNPRRAARTPRHDEHAGHRPRPAPRLAAQVPRHGTSAGDGLLAAQGAPARGPQPARLPGERPGVPRGFAAAGVDALGLPDGFELRRPARGHDPRTPDPPEHLPAAPGTGAGRH